MFLKVLRKKARLTQQEVADALGYASPQFVSNWERRKANAPEDKFKELSRLYDVPLMRLINYAMANEKKRMIKRLGGLK